MDIVAFPEFFTTGYLLDLINDAFYELAETIPVRSFYFNDFTEFKSIEVGAV